jgi:hypothetical protein
LTQTIPQNARNLWGEIKQAPRDLRGLISPEMNTQVRQQMNKPATLDRNAAMGMAMDYLQTTNPMGGLLAHTVYHGSPHKFNKFDMSKIGTGEGAQAYGHGLYFAESPVVAKSYQEALSGPDWTLRSDKTPISKELQDMLQSAYKDKKWQTGKADPYDAAEYVANAIKKDSPLYKEAQQVLRYPPIFPGGQMYKVDIPDEAIPRMLDWDAGGEQYYRDIVNEAGRSIRDRTGKYWDRIKDDPNRLMYRPGDVASMALRQQGIPGIKYFDGLSRGDKGGTRNFVLFDDSMARILEINGQPTGLLSWADEAK